MIIMAQCTKYMLPLVLSLIDMYNDVFCTAPRTHFSAIWGTKGLKAPSLLLSLVHYADRWPKVLRAKFRGVSRRTLLQTPQAPGLRCNYAFTWVEYV